MGYGIKSYWDGLLILMGVKAEEKLVEKADKVRELLMQGASSAQVVLAIARRCKANGGNWVHATISQTQQVLGLELKNARALVSEFTGQKTSI